MARKNWVEYLIGLLAVISIILVAIESLVALSAQWLLAIYIADLVVCIVFAAEFVYRLRQAPDRLGFLKSHGFEILAMVPALALYAAGSLPAISAGLRSLRLIRVVRVVFVIARLQSFSRLSSRFVRQSGLIYFFVAAIGIIFVGAFAALVLESGNPNAQIDTFSDALWWSISTVTTVGYGDIVPNSIAGRIMGMALMVVGIGTMAAFISQISASLVESRIKRRDEGESLRGTMIAEIKSKLDHIDKLSSSEVSLLVQMIESLRDVKEN